MSPHIPPLKETAKTVLSSVLSVAIPDWCCFCYSRLMLLLLFQADVVVTIPDWCCCCYYRLMLLLLFQTDVVAIPDWCCCCYSRLMLLLLQTDVIVAIPDWCCPPTQGDGQDGSERSLHRHSLSGAAGMNTKFLIKVRYWPESSERAGVELSFCPLPQFVNYWACWKHTFAIFSRFLKGAPNRL